MHTLPRSAFVLPMHHIIWLYTIICNTSSVKTEVKSNTEPAILYRHIVSVANAP